MHKASRNRISPSRPPLRHPKVVHQKAQARTSYCPAAPSLTKPAAPPPPPRPTLGPPPRPASHFRSSGTYLPTRQRGPRAKRRGHALQNSETTQTAPKRRCAGTTAKLTACAGRNTPLCVRDQRQRRACGRAGSRTSCAGASGRTSGGRGALSKCGPGGVDTYRVDALPRLVDAPAFEEGHAGKEEAYRRCTDAISQSAISVLTTCSAVPGVRTTWSRPTCCLRQHGDRSAQIARNATRVTMVLVGLLNVMFPSH